MVDDKFVIDKSPKNNNHFANFTDKNNKPVTSDTLGYSAGDTVFLTRRNTTFESKTGIRLDHLATTIGDPRPAYGKLICTHVLMSTHIGKNISTPMRV